MLADLDVTYGQGFGLARPAAALGAGRRLGRRRRRRCRETHAAAPARPTPASSTRTCGSRRSRSRLANVRSAGGAARSSATRGRRARRRPRGVPAPPRHRVRPAVEPLAEPAVAPGGHARSARPPPGARHAISRRSRSAADCAADARRPRRPRAAQPQRPRVDAARPDRDARRDDRRCSPPSPRGAAHGRAPRPAARGSWPHSSPRSLEASVGRHRSSRSRSRRRRRRRGRCSTQCRGRPARSPRTVRLCQARDKPMPTGRIRRTAKVAGLAGGQAARAYATRAANLTRGEEQRRAAAERRQLKAAEQIVEVLGQMKGAAMKVGQVASFIDLERASAGGAGALPAEARGAARLRAEGPVQGHAQGDRGGLRGAARRASSPSSTRSRWPPPRSARSTARGCTTAATWR